jgi:hypothetical protein
MGKNRKPPPHPKQVLFVLKDPKDLEPALFAELERLGSLYQKGRPEALLHAVDIVLRHYLSGSWVCEAFARRFGAWVRYEIPNLAEAFEVTRKGERVPEARLREDLRWPIVSAIVERLRQGLSREEAIEQTAEEYRRSESFVAKLYDNSPNTRKAVEKLVTVDFRLLDNRPALHPRRPKSRPGRKSKT